MLIRQNQFLRAHFSKNVRFFPVFFHESNRKFGTCFIRLLNSVEIFNFEFLIWSMNDKSNKSIMKFLNVWQCTRTIEFEKKKLHTVNHVWRRVNWVYFCARRKVSRSPIVVMHIRYFCTWLLFSLHHLCCSFVIFKSEDYFLLDAMIRSRNKRVCQDE